MKTLGIAAGLTLFACNLAAFAQSEVQCGQTLNAALRSGANLAIDSRPAGIEIVATDQEAIHVSCTSSDTDNTRDTRLRFSGTPTQAKLTISGPSIKNGNLQIRIEVPRKTNLAVQMPAGQIKVEEIEGDKNIELHAGQISISLTHKWNYRKIDASVGIGQVNAQIYGEEKGGFFRVFKKENPDGDYRLYAHVTTGQIELLGKQTHPASGSQ